MKPSKDESTQYGQQDFKKLVFIPTLFYLAKDPSRGFGFYQILFQRTICDSFDFSPLESKKVSRRPSVAPKINGIEDDNINDGVEEFTVINGTISDDDSDQEGAEKEVKMTLNELISGALESAFWAMDKLIVKDKEAGYRIR